MVTICVFIPVSVFVSASMSVSAFLCVCVCVPAWSALSRGNKQNQTEKILTGSIILRRSG